jgi:serine phosphatase RsbU (regulator of sigma subunit)
VRRARAALVAALLVTVTVVRIAADQPGLAIGFYALIPIVLVAFWFGVAATVAAAAAASALYLGSELVARSAGLEGAALGIAAANRAVVYFGVGVLVAALLSRERRMSHRLAAQQDQLDELESLRAALTPADLPCRPHLELAASFTPAEGIVAGDFFLISQGPAESTTVILGDVVGHGLEAAQLAAYVRTLLATFTAFTADPVRLLQLANAALAECRREPLTFVTAVCVNISSPPAVQLRWACAGHEPPWQLDTGEPLTGATTGVPLGIGTDELALTRGCGQLRPGQGIVVFTDGLTEGRAARRQRGEPVNLFGHDRIHSLIRSHHGAAPGAIVDALTDAAASFAGGLLADDLCVIACRTLPPTTPPTAAAPPVFSRAQAETGHNHHF